MVVVQDGAPEFMFKVLPAPHFQPHGIEEKASKAIGKYWLKKNRSLWFWVGKISSSHRTVGAFITSVIVCSYAWEFNRDGAITFCSVLYLLGWF